MFCVTFCKSVSVCFREIGWVCVKFSFKDTLSSIIFLVLQTLQTLGVYISIWCPKLGAVAIWKLKKYLVHGQARQVHPNWVLYTKALFSLFGKKISSTQQKTQYKTHRKLLPIQFFKKTEFVWPDVWEIISGTNAQSLSFLDVGIFLIGRVYQISANHGTCMCTCLGSSFWLAHFRPIRKL